MNQAILIRDVKRVEIIDRPMPERKPGEALLKVLYGGICGSDLGSYRGSFAYFDYPRIPGHEFSAEILEIDDNDRGLKPGMIVTCNPYFNCGKCYPCRRGHVNCCESNETMGCQRDGAFAHYITMPIERIYDGKGLPAKTLPLIEPFCISLHGVQRANIKPGEKVLIIGSGTIGMLAAKAAKMFGAEVTICDIAEEKLELAHKRGFTSTICNTSPEAFAQQVHDKTNGDGFDVTIEAVGLPSTFQNALDAVCFHGRVILIGVAKKNIDLFFTIIQKKELSVFGSRNALKEDFLYAIAQVKEGKLELDDIVTDIYSFEDAAKAFSEFDQMQGEKLKVLISFVD